MPTYQYSCTECGHFFEIFQSFSEDSLSVCPECEGRLRKVFNAVGVVFKGSGFYRTDSRGASNGTDGASPKAATNGADGGSAKGAPAGASSGSTSSGGTSSTGSGSSSSKPVDKASSAS